MRTGRFGLQSWFLQHQWHPSGHQGYSMSCIKKGGTPNFITISANGKDKQKNQTAEGCMLTPGWPPIWMPKINSIGRSHFWHYSISLLIELRGALHAVQINIGIHTNRSSTRNTCKMQFAKTIPNMLPPLGRESSCPYRSLKSFNKKQTFYLKI